MASSSDNSLDTPLWLPENTRSDSAKRPFGHEEDDLVVVEVVAKRVVFSKGDDTKRSEAAEAVAQAA